MPRHPSLKDEDADIDFPQSQDVTPEERKRVIALSKKGAKTDEDNSAMLGGGEGKKKISTADRLRTLFQQHNFSPVTKILRRLKVEEAKIEAYERAENMGLEPKLLSCLPKPDKKAYYTLLLQLVRFELPELKSIEMTGQIEAGMAVHIVHHAPQQKVIRIDAGAPAKLRALAGLTMAGTATLEAETKVVKDEDDI